MSIREEQLVSWSKAPSDTEDQRCLNAISQVVQAMTSRFGSDVEVYTQGSHKNRTNIRVDSDVDIVVQHKHAYLNDVSSLDGAAKAIYDTHFTPLDYTFQTFKNEVEATLRAAFPGDAVERKNKCIRIPGNTYRVNADVVPAFTHHRMQGGPYRAEAEGIKLIADDGVHVVSYPVQHHNNGRQKHTDTALHFKKAVRILKHIRRELVDAGIIHKDLASSHFIECLVWNQPHSTFQEDTFKDMLNNIVLDISMDMDDTTKANDYAEVSDLLWLFRGSAKRTPADAKVFADAAFSYIT
ncbi:MAG: hypothetical protein JWL75_286 [Parcubacteria group bacterium]|nr:hypothetical protein [Parcubacteria group bacterium]